MCVVELISVKELIDYASYHHRIAHTGLMGTTISQMGRKLVWKQNRKFKTFKLIHPVYVCRWFLLFVILLNYYDFQYRRGKDKLRGSHSAYYSDQPIH